MKIKNQTSWNGGTYQKNNQKKGRAVNEVIDLMTRRQEVDIKIIASKHKVCKTWLEQTFKYLYD